MQMLGALKLKRWIRMQEIEKQVFHMVSCAINRGKGTWLNIASLRLRGIKSKLAATSQ